VLERYREGGKDEKEESERGREGERGRKRKRERGGGKRENEYCEVI